MQILPYGKAICYSGYRHGQSPKTVIPSKEQIKEDLFILKDDGYRYLRMYDPNDHARFVLEHIREYHLPFQCIIGVDSYPEVNNPKCPFEEQNFSQEELSANIKRNDNEVEKLIALCNEFENEIIAISVGNENTPEWGTRIVPVDRLIRHAKRLKEMTDKPVTFCEGFLEWQSLQELAKEVDFISVHSYPLHSGKVLEESLPINKEHYAAMKQLYPDKQIVFTEVGWATRPSKAMVPGQATEENQTKYILQLTNWLEKEQIVGFIFEAFDEPWKGSTTESCECNWGLYYVDRTPKPVMKALKKPDA